MNFRKVTSRFGVLGNTFLDRLNWPLLLSQYNMTLRAHASLGLSASVSIKISAVSSYYEYLLTFLHGFHVRHLLPLFFVSLGFCLLSNNFQHASLTWIIPESEMGKKRWGNEISLKHSNDDDDNNNNNNNHNNNNRNNNNNNNISLWWTKRCFWSSYLIKTVWDMFWMKHHPSSVVQWGIKWSCAMSSVTKWDITWIIKDEGENRKKTQTISAKKTN